MRRPACRTVTLSLFLCSLVACRSPSFRADADDGVVDLSLLVAPEYPCSWPVGMQQYMMAPYRTIGPGGYNREVLVIDEHTGTQWDAPAHFIPAPDSGLPGAGANGTLTGDTIPAWQFVGEACVMDITEHVDDAGAGSSFLISAEMVQEWESRHRPLRAGDVLLLHSGFSDRYYRPFPAGQRFVADGLAARSPAWPGPTPECLNYLAGRGVMMVGIDSPSMGPLPDLARATHVAGAQNGMIFTEGAIQLGRLPPTGSFYALLSPKHHGSSGGEARALAVTDPSLAQRLVKSARARRVIDLSLLLDEALPVSSPGGPAGTEDHRYLEMTLAAFDASRPFFARSHVLDSQAGTHVVAPSFALPPSGFDDRDYAPEIRKALVEYEARFGARGVRDDTIEDLPLRRMMGPVHVVDVRSLVGSTSKEEWPASPVITLAELRRHEAEVAPVEAGEVVIFHSGYSDAHYRAFPEGNRMFAAPLAGEAEGWPAPTPEVVVYLAEKGVRCVATDAPTLGGVDPTHALMVYWAAGSRDLCIVEYLTNVGELFEKDAFFLFAPIKLDGCHGGYGRALALY